MRVIPPPRPGPRAAPCPPYRQPGPAPRHRRCHPHGQQAPASPAPTTSRTPSAAKPPGQCAAAPAQPPAPRSPPEAGRSPRAAHSPAAPAPGSPPAPQLAHPGATPQHPPDPGQHLPQPPRSTANTLTSRRSRTTPSVSHDSPPAPAHTTSEYLRGGKPQAFWCQSPRTIKPRVSHPPGAHPQGVTDTGADKPGRVKQVTPQLSSSCGMVKWVSPHFLRVENPDGDDHGQDDG